MKFKIYGLCFEFSSMRSEYFIFPPFLQMISFLRGMAFFCVCLFCWPLVLFLSLVSPFVLLCYPFFSALISIRDSGCYRILYIDNDLLISFPFLFMVYVCVCVSFRWRPLFISFLECSIVKWFSRANHWRILFCKQYKSEIYVDYKEVYWLILVAR